MAAYGTDDGFEAWLYEHGLDVPNDAPRTDMLRARASAYIDGYETYWTGQRTDGVMQDRGWPRSGATLNSVTAIADDVVPLAIIRAAYRAAWLEGNTPGILAGPAGTAGARVKRQKVDVVEREFFDDGKASVGGGPAFIDSIIDGAMQPFIRDTKAGAFMWSIGS